MHFFIYISRKILYNSPVRKPPQNMKISALMKQLKEVKSKHGDLEVTCTGCLAAEPTDNRDAVAAGLPFETTVENLVIHKSPWSGDKEFCVRLHM